MDRVEEECGAAYMEASQMRFLGDQVYSLFSASLLIQGLNVYGRVCFCEVILKINTKYKL
jgi:hypothetical protein